MKAAVGGFFHESNSFCSLSTTLKGFKEHTYLDTENVDEFVNAFADAREITGFVKALISHDATIVPLPVAMALPSGPVTYDTYAHIKKRMLEELQATPVDAVFLNLHGAAVVENIDDTEGDLLKSIRSIIGMDIPIFTVLDLHANVSQDMVDMSTVILGYNTEPHIDILERETECVDIFYRMKEEHLTLQTVIVQPPLLLPAICTDTTEGAMAPIMRAAFEAETNPEVINVSPFAGFYGSDKYCAGPSVICTTINNRQLAFDIASKISHLIWQLKDTFFVKLTPIPEIIPYLLLFSRLHDLSKLPANQSVSIHQNIIKKRDPELSHQVVVTLHEVSHHGRELLFLGFLQQTVEEHMERLQVEVCRHKTGELPVVIVLINLEELVLVSRYDGEPVLGYRFVELRVKLRETEGVDDIVHIGHHSRRHHVVLCLQLILTGLQSLDESLLSRGVLDRGSLPVLLFVQPVFGDTLIPCGGGKHTTQVTAHEEIPLTGCYGIAQDAHLGE